MSVRSRFTPDREGASLALTDRDCNLLVDLYLHHSMSREQIQSLYFTSLSRCNLRLRKLFDGGYVRRRFSPWAVFGCQAIYSLGPSAVELIAGRLETGVEEVRRLCRLRSPQLLRHTLEVVNFYLALLAALRRRPDVELESWLPEILVRHEYQVRSSANGRWHREVFKPDAFFRLYDPKSSSYLNYFVEIDLGNTASAQWEGKIQHYLWYWQCGLFAERYGCSSFRTLVVTTSENRLEHLQGLTDSGTADLFWFSTFERVRTAGPIAAVWSTAQPGRRALV